MDNITKNNINNSPAQKHSVVILMMAIPFLLGMGIDLYVPSLPHIANYFNTSSAAAQFTISIYMLGYATGQLILGILSDGLGRKKIIIVSAACFTFVSLIAAIAPNISSLIICRLLQGISVGGLAAIIRASATDCFTGLELAKAVGTVTTSWALGPIIGPFIGGYLQYAFNWQANFYFFSLYGLAIFIYAFKTLPETHHNLHPVQLSKFYCMSKTVFLNQLFLLYAIMGSLIYATSVVFNTVGPFLIQGTLNYSVVAYGYIALFLGFAYFLGNFINRIIINYLPPLKIALIAIICSLAMTIIFVVLGALFSLNLYIILIPIILLFFANGFIIPNSSARIASLFPKLAGTTSAIHGAIGAGGVFLITSLATMLTTNTQMPLAWLYLVTILVCLTLFISAQRVEKNVAP